MIYPCRELKRAADSGKVGAPLDVFMPAAPAFRSENHGLRRMVFLESGGYGSVFLSIPPTGLERSFFESYISEIYHSLFFRRKKNA